MAAFFLQNSFLAILILICQKLVQRSVIGEKMRSFRYSPAIIKGLKKGINLFQTDLYPHTEQSNLPNSARNRFAT